MILTREARFHNVALSFPQEKNSSVRKHLQENRPPFLKR
jgi:hypothetical protein